MGPVGYLASRDREEVDALKRYVAMKRSYPPARIVKATMMVIRAMKTAENLFTSSITKVIRYLYI